jgi:predicted nucleotidyltransferase
MPVGFATVDVSRPATGLLNQLDAAVLTVLSRSTLALTIREVHRLASAGSYDGVRLSLRRLARSGLLFEEQRSSGTFYRLNRDHLACPAVESLLGMRGRMLSLAAEAIARWSVGPLHASVFGSAARGDGDADSDIDLLIVFDDATYARDALWADAVSDLGAALQRWTGNRAAILTMGLAEIRAMAAGRRARPLWKALRSEAVTIFGEDLGGLAG